MEAADSFESLLRDTHELETFLHQLIEPLARRNPQPGEDVTRYVEELGLKMPRALAGSSIEWAGHGVHEEAAAAAPVRTLVFVRPGMPEALGLTIGCIRIRNVVICLECGWFWCRIVIIGRF